MIATREDRIYRAADYYRKSVNMREHEELAELVQTHLGPTHLDTLKSWVQAAFASGQIDGDKGMSGAAAEAARDCRKAGYHDAAELIEKKTIPETLEVEKQNAISYAAGAVI